MDGAYRVAQATNTVTGNIAQPRIYTLTKPLADQAVTVNIGYDQKVQVDFSAIANERITLVHIGEKLVILFDNSSTVTVEPFFDSRHDALHNITVQVAPGREISVAEFTQQFAINTDLSVLPAADVASINANANVQASGAHFDPAAVDPLALPNPLPLLPQEELPTFNVTLPTGTTTNQTAPTVPPPPPTITAGIANLVVDESFIPAGETGPAGSTPDLVATQGHSLDTESFAVTVNAPGGVQSITYALSVPGATATTGVDSTMRPRLIAEARS